jgi:hypothetical protein
MHAYVGAWGSYSISRAPHRGTADGYQGLHRPVCVVGGLITSRATATFSCLILVVLSWQVDGRYPTDCDVTNYDTNDTMPDFHQVPSKQTVPGGKSHRAIVHSTTYSTSYNPRRHDYKVRASTKPTAPTILKNIFEETYCAHPHKSQNNPTPRRGV